MDDTEIVDIQLEDMSADVPISEAAVATAATAVSSATTMQRYHRSYSVSPWVSGGLQCSIVACFLLALLLNGALVVVYVRRRGFRAQISHRFLLNLVLANLFSALATTVPSIAELHDDSDYHRLLTAATDTVLCSAAAASILAQLLVGADQFLAVTDPLHYHSGGGKTRCRLLCGISWALALSVGAAVAVDEAGVVGADVVGVSSYTATVLFCLVFLFPFLALIYIYSRVLFAAHSNSVRTRRNSVGSATLDSFNAAISSCENSHNNDNSLHSHSYHQVAQTASKPHHFFRKASLSSYFNHSTNHHHHHHHHHRSHHHHLTHHGQKHPPPLHHQHSRVGLYLNTATHSVRHRISDLAGAVSLRHHEESRAARATALVLLSLLVSFSPYFALLLLQGEFKAAMLPEAARPISLALAALSPAVTPLLYAFRSRQVRRDFHRAFGLSATDYPQRRQRGPNGFPPHQFPRPIYRPASTIASMQREMTVSSASAAPLKHVFATRQKMIPEGSEPRDLGGLDKSKSSSCPQLVVSPALERKLGQTMLPSSAERASSPPPPPGGYNIGSPSFLSPPGSGRTSFSSGTTATSATAVSFVLGAGEEDAEADADAKEREASMKLLPG